MKKGILIISALFVVINSIGQIDSIPNNAFESWTASTPDGWGTSNNILSGGVTKATGVDILGANTIMLVTHTMNPGGGVVTVPGVASSKSTIASVSSGPPLVISNIGGFPFRLRPTELTFYAKYSSSNVNDSGLVQVVLTKWRPVGSVNVVGGITTTITTARRDTLSVSRIKIGNSVSGYSQQTLPMNYSNMPLGGNPTTITNYLFGAYAPDSAQILLSSLAATTGDENATLWVDSLDFQYGGCHINPSIVSSGQSTNILPLPGSVLSGVAGQTFTYYTTVYIPSSVNSPAPATVDSIRVTPSEFSTTTGATNFLNISSIWPSGRIGNNTIACITITGTVPVTPENITYDITMTPLVWGTSAFFGELYGFQDPNPTTHKIKVGQGSSPTGLEGISPEAFDVAQNAPNPFSQNTNITFTVPTDGIVQFNLVDLVGTIVDSKSINALAGKNSFNYANASIESGTYFYTILYNGSSITKKLIVQK